MHIISQSLLLHTTTVVYCALYIVCNIPLQLLFKMKVLTCLIRFKHSKIILRNTILEWEPICSIYLRLSSRHCRSLPLCHQPRQQLATSRCLTHHTCVAVRPDCHVIETVQGNSNCLGPLQTYVNGVHIYQEKNSNYLIKTYYHISLVLIKVKFTKVNIPSYLVHIRAEWIDRYMILGTL